MQIAVSKINPCLWFDTEAEEAAKFYCSVFKDSRMGRISRYVNEGQEIHGKKAGSVMAVEFEIAGQKFAALNGGPHSSSLRPSRSKCIAKIRKRSTISGRSYPRAARRVLAVG